MKVGILGSGAVGKALAAGFLKYGYAVMAGSRSPEKLEGWKAEIGQSLQTGDLAATAAFGDIIVLATKGYASKAVLEQAGIDNFSGKTVVDATNPIMNTEPVNGVLQYFTAAIEPLAMLWCIPGFRENRWTHAFKLLKK